MANPHTNNGTPLWQIILLGIFVFSLMCYEGGRKKHMTNYDVYQSPEYLPNYKLCNDSYHTTILNINTNGIAQLKDSVLRNLLLNETNDSYSNNIELYYPGNDTLSNPIIFISTIKRNDGLIYSDVSHMALLKEVMMQLDVVKPLLKRGIMGIFRHIKTEQEKDKYLDNIFNKWPKSSYFVFDSNVQHLAIETKGSSKWRLNINQMTDSILELSFNTIRNIREGLKKSNMSDHVIIKSTSIDEVYSNSTKCTIYGDMQYSHPYTLQNITDVIIQSMYGNIYSNMIQEDKHFIDWTWTTDMIPPVVFNQSSPSFIMMDKAIRTYHNNTSYSVRKSPSLLGNQMIKKGIDAQFNGYFESNSKYNYSIGAKTYKVIMSVIANLQK